MDLIKPKIQFDADLITNELRKDNRISKNIGSLDIRVQNEYIIYLKYTKDGGYTDAQIKSTLKEIKAFDTVKQNNYNVTQEKTFERDEIEFELRKPVH